MSKLIDTWKQQQKTAYKLNKQFVRKLKLRPPKQLDEIGGELHEAVFSEIDCLDCANCCKSIPPILNDNDIRRLSKSLGISNGDFHEKYVRIDEDGDRVMATTPCPFLMEDNACIVYVARPKACRQYPHTDRAQFVSSLKLHAENSSYCPAVFHILQRLQHKLD